MRRLWMNQSYFSLGFLSQNSLWKLSTFHGYKSLYIIGWEGMWKFNFFLNRVVWRLGLATRLSREFKLRANILASLSIRIPMNNPHWFGYQSTNERSPLVWVLEYQWTTPIGWVSQYQWITPIGLGIRINS